MRTPEYKQAHFLELSRYMQTYYITEYVDLDGTRNVYKYEFELTPSGKPRKNGAYKSHTVIYKDIPNDQYSSGRIELSDVKDLIKRIESIPLERGTSPVLSEYYERTGRDQRTLSELHNYMPLTITLKS